MLWAPSPSSGAAPGLLLPDLRWGEHWVPQAEPKWSPGTHGRGAGAGPRWAVKVWRCWCCMGNGRSGFQAELKWLDALGPWGFWGANCPVPYFEA